MNHIHDKINEHFAQKGAKVIYNMLGYTDELVYAYVNNFSKFLIDRGVKKSNHYKLQCYNQLYPIDGRPKFTGFENYSKIDKKFRRDISPLISQSQFCPTLIVDHYDIKHSDKTYKQCLKKTVKSIDKPLLYLSGGIDSELVALAMIDADVKFTPVIFNYVNDNGQTLNLFDFKHSYKFCQKHGLFPITKSINIEKLWSSKEFSLLAIEMGIVSPQLVTHAYMIQLLQDEFKDYTHVFGGEVRFETDFIAPDTHKSANLVYLNKTSNLGFDAGVYVDDDPTSPYSQTNVSVYCNTNYTFTIVSMFENTYSYPVWYTVTGTPSATFYVAITGVTGSTMNAGASYSPTTSTSYAEIVGQSICFADCTSGGGSKNAQVTFTVSIYGSAGGVSTAASGSVSLEATQGI